MTFGARLRRLAGRHAPIGLVRHSLNRYLQGFAHMLDLHIDPATGSARASLLLAGEERAIECRIESFSFNDDGALVIHRAQVDRAWVDTLVQNLLIDRPLSVPRETADLMRGLFRR